MYLLFAPSFVAIAVLAVVGFRSAMSSKSNL